jgi:hypothetical protein
VGPAWRTGGAGHSNGWPVFLRRFVSEPPRADWRERRGCHFIHGHDDVDQALKLLHAAGWSVGDTAFVTEAGTLVWLVSGRNGENVIRAEGPTQGTTLRAACDQARAVGMFAGWRVSQFGVG